jgi:hypothetical protein
VFYWARLVLVSSHTRFAARSLGHSHGHTQSGGAVWSGVAVMSRKQEQAAMPVELGGHANSSPPTLSQECKHQLAVLIANMIAMHLGTQPVFDAGFDADQVRSSSDDFKSNNISIKEDCHAHHRSTFDQDHRLAPAEDRVCLLASIEHGASS